jgi:hypothetical protein
VKSLASIRLDWREAQEGDLPMVCATCGDDATEMVDVKLTKLKPRILVNIRQWTNVLLPCCPAHRTPSWNGFLRVKATAMDEHGITLVQVSPDFVAAVQEYRDDPDAYERRERNRAAGIARPRPRTGSGGRIAFAILMTLGVVVLVSCCGFGFLFINLWKSGAPGFGPKRPGIETPEPNGPLGPPNVPRPARRP